MDPAHTDSEVIIAARMQAASRLAAAILQACPPTEPGAESLQERTFHEALRIYNLVYQALEDRDQRTREQQTAGLRPPGRM
jgi:hypothetical protein